MRQRNQEDTWVKKYAEWCRRRGGTLQCAPLGVLAAIVVFGAVCYVYREVIITTLLTALFAAASAGLFAGATILTISTLRWYRKRSRAMAVDPSGTVAVNSMVEDEDVNAISREADQLALKGTELIFDNEGNLHAKVGKGS